MQAHRAQVLSRYRELLRLIERLPAEKAATARSEAQQTIRDRRKESDPEAQLHHLKELVAKISFLRITTPRPVGEKLDAGSYVLRDGQLVKGSAEDKGARYMATTLRNRTPLLCHLGTVISVENHCQAMDVCWLICSGTALFSSR